MTLIFRGATFFDNGSRPSGIAGVRPALDYRFARDRSVIEAVSLTNKLTHTRNTVGSYIGASGAIELAQVDQPRFTHDASTGRSLGLVVEAESRNILPGSNLLLNANYWWFGDSPTQAVLYGSNRFGDYYKVDNIPSFGNTHYRTAFNVNTQSGNYYVFSANIKNHAGGNPTIEVSLLNTVTGTTTGRAATPYSSGQPIENGWVRVTANLDQTSRNGDFLRIDHRNTTPYLIQNPQLELRPRTSYIDTTGSSVQRQETSSIDGTGVLTGAYTMVEKPEGCAVVDGLKIVLQPGFIVERVMVFPTALSSQQITDIRSAM